MFAKKREAGGGGDGDSPSSSSSLPPPLPPPPISHHYDPTAAVGNLVSSLNKRRMYREVKLALRSGIRDATAEFSFLRIRGLRVLLKSIRSIADNDAAIALFHHSQSVPELQVVPVLFHNTLNHQTDQSEDPVLDMSNLFGVDLIKIRSPASVSEVALGLRVLEGCCLLHKESKHLAHQQSAIKVLVNLLTTRGTLEQGACLDALVSLMLDSPSNQLEFEACHGVEKIAELIKDEHGNEAIRLKCGEFLLLLIGHLNGREWPPLATIHDDIRNLLGEKCASFIWAASQFGSTLDPEQRQTALQIQARRVLEALEFV